MPWKERSVMDEKMMFVGRLLSGEKMTDLCKEFGISRVTGHRLWKRYKRDGSKGLYNRSRAPNKHPNQLPFEIEQIIVRFKKEKPKWGAPKIRELVRNRYPAVKLPAISTVHCVLDRHGLVDKHKRRKKYHATATYLSIPKEPNDLWCTDFKGQFRMGNRAYCYPLTISDSVSRFILGCEALSSTNSELCFAIFEEVFQEHGLPLAIRNDNGTPFACGNSTWNMTKLSVWWLRLGIRLERIKPGNPQQNGRHERMHRTLKLEATNPAVFNMLQQQERFDRFRNVFNFERPHQALNMKCPAEVYKKSSRPYEGLPDISYPEYDKTLLITNCGSIKTEGRKIHIARSLANQPVGLKEIDEGIWQVDFMHYTLGYFDEECEKFSPRDDPFGLKIDNWN